MSRRSLPKSAGISVLVGLFLTLFLATNGAGAAAPSATVLTEPQPCLALCEPPPEVENPDPAHSALVINVGWPADAQGRGGSPLEPGKLSVVTDFLNQTGNQWLRDSAPGVWQDWSFFPAGSFTIETPRNAANAGCTKSQQSDYFADIRSRAKAAAEAIGWHPDRFTRVFINWLQPLCGASGISSPTHKDIGITGPGTVDLHELGHTFRLDHAQAIFCTDGSGQAVPLSNTCTVSEYGDDYDVMGGGQGPYSAANAYKLGWLSGQFASVAASVSSQTFTLKPYGELPHGLRAIRLTDGSSTYWIEYRARVGLDAQELDKFRPVKVTPGLIVHREGPAANNYFPVTELIDMTPSLTLPALSAEDAGLPVGQTWANPLGTMRITLNDISAAGASVMISSQLAKVPNLAGLKLAQARPALEAAGFAYGGVSEELDASCEFIGVIKSASPDFGSVVSRGATVTLHLGKEDPKHRCF